MLLRVASHAELKGLALDLHGRAVGEEAFIEAVHLLNELQGMGVAAGRWHVHRLLACLVATQQEQVFDAEELQVEQGVLDIFLRRTGTYNMRDDRDAPPLLDGGGNGDGAGATTDTLPLHQSTIHLVIDVLRTMGGDIDVARIERRQGLDSLEERLGARTLQGRKHLKAETWEHLIALVLGLVVDSMIQLS